MSKALHKIGQLSTRIYLTPFIGIGWVGGYFYRAVRLAVEAIRLGFMTGNQW